MRTRTKANIAVPTAYVTQNDKSTTPYIGDAINLGKTFTDLLTPGYFKLKRENRHLPVNPASSSEMYFTPGGGETSHEVWYAGNNNGWKWAKQRTVTLSGCIYLSAAGQPSLPSLGIGSLPTFQEDEFQALLTRAAANAMTASMDLLTFSLESRKTLELVTGVAGRTLQRAHSIAARLGSKKSGYWSRDDFASAWLEHRYGWRPLMYDILDASELIQKLMDGASELQRSSLTTSKDGSSVTTKTQTAGFGYRDLANQVSGYEVNQGLRYDHIIRKTGRVELRAGIMIRDAVRSYATVDPIVTGWEIIPFSFVLDWLVNVGDFLTVLSPFSSSEMLHAYRTITTIEETSIASTPIPRDYSFNSGITQYRAKGAASPTVIGREGWMREPVNKLVPTIGRGSGLNILKGLDSLALLHGRTAHLRRFTTI